MAENRIQWEGESSSHQYNESFSNQSDLDTSLDNFRNVFSMLILKFLEAKCFYNCSLNSILKVISSLVCFNFDIVGARCWCGGIFQNRKKFASMLVNSEEKNSAHGSTRGGPTYIKNGFQCQGPLLVAPVCTDPGPTLSAGSVWL